MNRHRCLIAVAVSLLARTVSAQEAPAPAEPVTSAASDTAAGKPAGDADKAFADAMALIAQDRYADAIEKLEEAQRLDPGIGTQFNLAICYAKVGQLALAWHNFRQVEALAGAAGKEARRDAARAQLELLRPRLADVSVRLEEPGSVYVTVDGVVIPPSELGFIALNPGEHRLEGSAPGKRPFVETFVVVGTERHDLIIPVMASVETRTEIRTVPLEVTNSRRTLGFVLGSVGVVGVAAAAVTGGLILSAKSIASDRCHPDCVTPTGDVDNRGADAVQRGTTLLPINVVAWIVAGAGLGAGTFFFLTSRKRPSKAGQIHVAPFVDGRVGSGLFTF